MLAHAILVPLALSAMREFKICEGGTCRRGGSKQFFSAAQALSCTSADDVDVKLTFCLGPCPSGVAVRHSEGKGTFVVKQIFAGEEAASLAVESAAEVLTNEFELDVEAPRKVLNSFLKGTGAIKAGNVNAAVASFTTVIESDVAREVMKAARLAAADVDAAEQQLPVFTSSKTGIAAEREYERLRPGRVRWLYEALCGRCEARLAEGGDANACAALSDAREATELCSLAGEGWYRLLDAAEASGDEPTATAARDELTRLGYSLEAGEEGMQAQDAKPAMKLDYWGRPMA